MNKMHLMGLPLATLAFVPQVFASVNLPKSFYTDDSAHYLKLYKDGLEQRFRVAAQDCEQIDKAEILIFDKEKGNISYPMVQVNEKEIMDQWPLPYGISPQEHCWFRGKVSNHSLHDNILYTIKVRNKANESYYFNAEIDSLLPINRFRPNIDQWISLGALGATVVNGGGTFFKVWEPEAERVDIRINEDKTYQMLTPTTKANTHTLYLEDVKPSDKYALYFVKDGEYENLQVGNNGHFSTLKVDPMAKKIVYDKKGGELNGYLNPQALVTPESTYKWRHDFSPSYKDSFEYNNWIIYELWPLTFNPKEVNGKFQSGTFKDIAEKIDYLSNLGITTVELLPIHESRFKVGWGYALDSLTLVQESYGTPDELRSLVDQMHERKLKVLFDVVLNHVNNSLIRDPLTSTRHDSKYYGAHTDWGPMPKFKDVMVRKWISDSLLNLVRDYHLDGFRFDAIDHIFKGNLDGYKFLQELNIMLKMINPHFYSSAEQLPDNVWITYPTEEEGLAFDSQWNDKFKNFFERGFDYYREDQRDLDISAILGALNGYSNQSFSYGEYHFGDPARTVNFLGSHDVVGNKDPFIRIISNFRNHEMVGNNEVTRIRPLEIPEKEKREADFRLIHNPFNHDASLIGYGILFTKPGASLLFQGEELAADLNIENEWVYVDARENNSIPTKDVDADRYIRSNRVPWEYLAPEKEPSLDFLTEKEKRSFKEYHKFFKDLVTFKKNYPKLHEADAKDIKQWDKGVFSYRITRGNDEHFVLVNFSYDKPNLWINFPGTASNWWDEDIALTQRKYGQGKLKFRNIISNLGGRANNVRLAGPSISIFTKKKYPKINEDLYLRTSSHSWAALEDFKLKKSSHDGETYSTIVDIDQNQSFEFKIATKDWSVDLGISNEASALESFFIETYEGHLTYYPDRANAHLALSKGKYLFTFSLRTFKYSFIKL